jgi:transposase
MAQALSIDLRSRVIKAFEGGLSCRAAAIQFGISAATAVRWRARHKQTGQYEAKARCGNMRVWKLDDVFGVVMEVFEANRKTFSKLKANLRRIGERTVIGFWDVIGTLVTTFHPQECQNYFASCGYNAE